jgi:hypothetical protein
MSAEISIEWIKANAAFVASRIVKLERENADLRAKLARLDGLTNWVCSCGGTDCKGQEENAALKAAYNKLETDLMNEVDDLRFENAGLRVELERQAVCNGKGSEREAALRAKVETLERENAALRSALHHRIACLEIKLDAFQQVFERLRDCDWEIGLPEQMDAVREIARKALEWKEAQP